MRVIGRLHFTVRTATSDFMFCSHLDISSPTISPGCAHIESATLQPIPCITATEPTYKGSRTS